MQLADRLPPVIGCRVVLIDRVQAWLSARNVDLLQAIDVISIAESILCITCCCLQVCIQQVV